MEEQATLTPEQLEQALLERIKPYEERINKLEVSEKQKEAEIAMLKQAVEKLENIVNNLQVPAKQGNGPSRTQHTSKPTNISSQRPSQVHDQKNGHETANKPSRPTTAVGKPAHNVSSSNVSKPERPISAQQQKKPEPPTKKPVQKPVQTPAKTPLQTDKKTLDRKPVSVAAEKKPAPTKTPVQTDRKVPTKTPSVTEKKTISKPTPQSKPNELLQKFEDSQHQLFKQLSELKTQADSPDCNKEESLKKLEEVAVSVNAQFAELKKQLLAIPKKTLDQVRSSNPSGKEINDIMKLFVETFEKPEELQKMKKTPQEYMNTFSKLSEKNKIYTDMLEKWDPLSLSDKQFAAIQDIINRILANASKIFQAQIKGIDSHYIQTMFGYVFLGFVEKYAVDLRKQLNGEGANTTTEVKKNEEKQEQKQQDQEPKEEKKEEQVEKEEEEDEKQSQSENKNEQEGEQQLSESQQNQDDEGEGEEKQSEEKQSEEQQSQQQEQDEEQNQDDNNEEQNEDNSQVKQEVENQQKEQQDDEENLI